MAKPITIAETTYPSRTAAQSELRRRWNNYELGDVVTDGGDIAFFDALVAMHHNAREKRGSGIAHFIVVNVNQDKPWRAEARAVWIVQVDGSEVEFSAPKAIDGPGSTEATVRAALRNEVRETTGAFREDAFRRGLVTCDVTEIVMCETSEAETRHVEPSFKSLVEGFMADLGLTYESVPLENIQTPITLESGRTFTGARVKDPDLRSAWQRFHLENAVLRIRHQSVSRVG